MVYRLEGEKLVKLIGKLTTLSIDSWKRNIEKDNYEPHPDSGSVGYDTTYTIYKTSLGEFNILMSSEHPLSLRVLNGSNILYEGTDWTKEGLIARLFNKVDTKFRENRELQKRKLERDIENRFENALK